MQFNDYGLLNLDNFISKRDSRKFTERIFKLKEEGQTWKDDPVSPSADSFYQNNHAVVKDKILKAFHELMAKEISIHVGKELVPTYLYGRIYKKGADVYRHKDRPECEYSVSLTLDSSEEEKTWPIFFKAKDDKEYKVEMNAGDAVIYKGQEVEHWRSEKLDKDWQSQLFLHFVDAKGENANTAVTERMRILDKNNRLSSIIPGKDYQKVGTGNHQFLNPKSIEDAKKEKLIAQGFDEKNAEYVLRGPSTWNYQGKEGIDNEVCEYYKKKYEQLNLYPALIGGDRIDNEEDSHVDLTIRNVMKADLTTWSGITAHLVSAAVHANRKIWQFDIDGMCNQSEYLQYNASGKYDQHSDQEFRVDPDFDYIRKLSALTIINKSNEFEGGKFYIYHNMEKVYPPQEQGDIIVFPSDRMHGCEPITKGTRHAVIAWLNGPRLK